LAISPISRVHYFLRNRNRLDWIREVPENGQGDFGDTHGIKQHFRMTWATGQMMRA
jgi:hypothetical protein